MSYALARLVWPDILKGEKIWKWEKLAEGREISVKNSLHPIP
jgi:hypothetical protein